MPCVDYARAATIIGDEKQVLRLELLPGRGVRTEPHSMKWSGPEIELGTTEGKGGLGDLFDRVVSGGSLFLTEYHCTGAAPAAITLVFSVQP